MLQDLTVAFITNRLDPKIEWFLDSLDRQLDPPQDRPRIVIIDFWKDERPLDTRGAIHSAPKPNVWQGKHRLTKENWWGTASARNSALCLTSTSWLAYVDDVCVLGDRWIESVKHAMRGNYFVFGAYRKAKNMVVERGELKSFDTYSQDNRARGNADAVSCNGDWLYGCSLAGPTEQFLEVGGWPEMADGLSFEDCLMGISLQNRGYSMRYDERMLTTESEDDHGKSTPFRRTDKGVSPNDKSHSALSKARGTSFWENPIPGGIREVRQKVLRGEPFPIQSEPQTDWYDGQKISEMI